MLNRLRRLSRSVLYLTAVAAVLPVVLSAQMKVTTTPKPEPDPRTVQLEQRIRDLEARVKAIEDEGDFPQDDPAKGAAQPAGRDAGGGAGGRGGESGASSGRGAARATRLTAPFEVVDDAGKVVLKVEKGPAGGGVVTALTSNGGVAAQFGVGSTGFAGSVRLHKDGKELAALGVANDSGALVVSDPLGRQRFAVVGATGAVLRDESGRERISLGFAEGGRGFVAVRNTAGIEVGNLFESPNGVGSLVTRDGDGQGVQIGTKTRASGAFGDVCATSPKGGMCLSVLAIKAMSPY
jgi:hypothetical protein